MRIRRCFHIDPRLTRDIGRRITYSNDVAWSQRQSHLRHGSPGNCLENPLCARPIHLVRLRHHLHTACVRTDPCIHGSCEHPSPPPTHLINAYCGAGLFMLTLATGLHQRRQH
ncbi:hypothetical protein EI94DRAFT_1733748 [Lactarius quietus]|nr:hypothetical protein EI94DRAFT_1752682 [Lactarius quietus]KAF8266169.1 hypothetical protein EI94DRAFT_1733748 [Lactarius quietus]